MTKKKTWQNKAPTWKKINSKKNVPNSEWRKENNRLRKFLEKHGWSMWDHCNIYEEGYEISARKLIPELAHNYNCYIFFRWQWYEEFSTYWRASISGAYNYEPENKYMHPWGHFEIDQITHDDLPYLPVLEKRIVAAVLSQTRIKETKDNEKSTKSIDV